jgi:hypothetical protein
MTDRYTTQTKTQEASETQRKSVLSLRVKNLCVGATPTPRRFALSQGSFNSDLDKWVWTFDRWAQPNRVYICSTHPPADTLHSKSTTFAIP